MTKLDRYLKEREQIAYQRGFRDAMRGLAMSVKRLKKKASRRKGAKKPKRRRAKSRKAILKRIVEHMPRKKPTRSLRKGSHPHRVFEFIRDTKMAMRSIDVVRAMREQEVKDRTTRTSLNRLKDHGFIEKREGRWYSLVA